MNVDHPESFLTDQGSIFMLAPFADGYKKADTHLRPTEAESHNSLGSNEKFHHLLKQTYSKLKTF